eukprot:1397786-Pleurochrysis_carterae.AAC.2
MLDARAVAVDVEPVRIARRTQRLARGGLEIGDAVAELVKLRLGDGISGRTEEAPREPLLDVVEMELLKAHARQRRRRGRGHRRGRGRERRRLRGNCQRDALSYATAAIAQRQACRSGVSNNTRARLLLRRQLQLAHAGAHTGADAVRRSVARRRARARAMLRRVAPRHRDLLLQPLAPPLVHARDEEPLRRKLGRLRARNDTRKTSTRNSEMSTRNDTCERTR